MEENKKFQTEFIEIYREHACLWGVNSNEYSNKHKQNAVYEILFMKLKVISANSTMEVVKKKIANSIQKRIQKSKRKLKLI